MRRVGMIRGEGPDVLRRVLWLLAFAWLPLPLLALAQGRALAATPEESFLLDLGAWTRFFVALPVLIFAEASVGPRLRAAGLHFLRAGLVREKDGPAMQRAIRLLAARRESRWVEWALLVVAFGISIGLRALPVYASGHIDWRMVPGADGPTPSLAGAWYHLVSVTLLQFLFYRWSWRVAIWSVFLFRVSRLDLDLTPTHPDEAGGLGVLGNAQASLSILGFGLGSVLCGRAAFLMIYEGAPWRQFIPQAASLGGLSVLMALGPLLVFSPLMARCRREGLRSYGVLADRYVKDFHAKWLEGAVPANEALLGSGDVQSLADIGASFARVEQMRTVPFGLRAFLQVVAVGCAPLLPLVFLAVPLRDIVELLKSIFL